jgi:hypothetical protein
MVDSTGKRPDVISRRQALKTVAVGGTVLGGAAWIAPAIISTVAAQAAGSPPPPSVQGSTVVPTSSTTTTTDASDAGSSVLGNQVSKLPVTGINVKPVVATGLGLIAGGAVVAAMADRVPADTPAPEED